MSFRVRAQRQASAKEPKASSKRKFVKASCLHCKHAVNIPFGQVDAGLKLLAMHQTHVPCVARTNELLAESRGLVPLGMPNVGKFLETIGLGASIETFRTLANQAVLVPHPEHGTKLMIEAPGERRYGPERFVDLAQCTSIDLNTRYRIAGMLMHKDEQRREDGMALWIVARVATERKSK